MSLGYRPQWKRVGTTVVLRDSGLDLELPNSALILGNTVPALDPSAIFQMDSTTQGLLPPRMTTAERNAITAAVGLVIFNTDTGELQVWDGSAWSNSTADTLQEVFDNGQTINVDGVGGIFQLETAIVANDVLRVRDVSGGGVDTVTLTGAGDLVVNSVSGDGSGLTNLPDLAIGDTVTGAADQRILFTNGTTLAQDSNFLWNDSTNILQAGGTPAGAITNANLVYSGKFYARETSTSAQLGSTSMEYSSGTDTGFIRVTKETGPGGTFDNFNIRMSDATFASHRDVFSVNQTEIVINETGADYNFRVEGDTEANLIFADSTNSNVGIGTGTPNAVARLDVSSTTQGFLPPRMTTVQRDLITAVAGLTIYNTTVNELQTYNGTVWENSTLDGWDEVMHAGNTFTVLDGENINVSIINNDITNNPASIVLGGTSTGNDITSTSWSIDNGGTFTTGGDINIGIGSVINYPDFGAGAVVFTDNASDLVSSDAQLNFNPAGQLGVGTNTQSAKVDIVVADTDNIAALEVNQNDITNNPVGIQIVNAGTGNDITATNWSMTQGGDLTARSAILDTSAETFASLELTPRAAAPTTGALPGQLVVAGNNLFVYDDIRTKWLNVAAGQFTFSSNGNIDNSYLRFGQMLSSTSGALMPVDSTIVALGSDSAGGDAAKGFELQVNGVSQYTWNNVANQFTATNLDVNVNAGDRVTVFCVAAGGTVLDPAVNVWFKPRLD